MGHCEHYRIRPMRLSDMQLFFEWCGSEGWNPGVAEGPAYVALDPDGLHLGELNQQPVAGIFGVKTGHRLAHMGGYLVVPSVRGKGFGLPLFQHALARIDTQTVGCDGVLPQASNYAKEGFRPFAKSYRLRYRARGVMSASCDLVPLFRDHVNEMFELDCRAFGTDRRNFLDEWVRIPASRGLLAVRDSAIIGYGHIRPAYQGFRVGPLVADSVSTAEAILEGLGEQAKATEMDLDVCAANSHFEDFCEHLNLQTIFETVRMYRGSVPKVDWDRQFAMAGMEIG